MAKDISILIIYTGGTIGMVQDTETDSLVPFNFENITEQVPEIKRFGYILSTIAFDPPLDSSDVTPDVWIKIARIIEDNYIEYDGFVILHGTDTMAYAASALSFLLEDLCKPVIFTGSQLPLGYLRTDGKENLITSIEIAAAKRYDGRPAVPEVCIYFESKLLRGNRTTKNSAEDFLAFQSNNYAPLAEAGIHLKFNFPVIQYCKMGKFLKVHQQLESNIVLLKLFPGIKKTLVNSILMAPGLKGIIIESFGSGNAPAHTWFIEAIAEAIKNEIVVLNITQCNIGKVDMGVYAASIQLLNAGVISGADITTEAAVAKMMYVLGRYNNYDDQVHYLSVPINGEITS